MEIFQKIPNDIQHRLFLYFEHPTAKIIKFHHRPHHINNLIKDIRDYNKTLQLLYNLPFAKDHDGKFGRARLLNSLWIEGHLLFGNYYKIWERMYRIRSTMTAERWSCLSATKGHEFQINSLWALFTPHERKCYLQRKNPPVDYYQV